ncbi:MAG: protein kinase [Verrucomicrobiota bacterium]
MEPRKMTTLRTCPQCGVSLPGGTSVWLCPKCLLGQAASSPLADSNSADAREISIPRAFHSFGDYELLEEISRGGMGVVYKARQVSLNRIVAVKMLQFGRLASDEFKRRFRVEAEAVASLQHPNIVAIHEVGEHEGQQYFSMDFVEGPDLAMVVREKPLPARRSAAYLKTIAEAIHHAHQRGILHRDLKPSNVLIDSADEPRVTDFGLAKRIVAADMSSVSNDLTSTGQVLGTPHYIPPEQACGKRANITPASDVYSLGAILYHLLTGRPPFIADTLEATLTQLLQNDPVPPRLLNASVPRDLETICLKCLGKEPSRRYHSAQALADDLARWLNDEPILARPVSVGEKFWRWCRRKPALATLVLTLLFVAGTGVTGIFWQWRRAEQHAASENVQRTRAENVVMLLEHQRAEGLLEKDETVMGVAYLARMVRQQPANRVAAQRLLSALTLRNFPLPVGPPLSHAAKVNYAEFSPDGRWVATASLDLTARIWDGRTGEPVTGPLLHSDAVRFAHFSPDGLRLLTVSDDARAQFWDARTGRRLDQSITHLKQIRSAQFSPDGRLVVTASDDGTARIWDVTTGEPVLGPFKHQGSVQSASFSPDARWLVTSGADNVAQIWDTRTGQSVAKPLPHAAGVNWARFSPDSQWVVTASDDHTARVWQTESGEPLGQPLIHKDRVYRAEFSPDGELVATASRDETTRIWRARTGQPVAEPLRLAPEVSFVEFSPDGQRLLMGPAQNGVWIGETLTGQRLLAPMQHDATIWSARFSPDGQFVVTTSADKTAQIWDVRPGRALSEPMVHSGAVGFAEFSPDGEWIATASGDRTARIWNARTGQTRGSPLQHAEVVAAVRFSPDGERVATCSHDGTARVWDARTGQPLTGPLTHGCQVDSVEFSPDGKWIGTASAQNGVWVWNARTGELRPELGWRGNGCQFARFSQDGQRLVIGVFDVNLARILDCRTGRPPLDLQGHEGWIFCAEFSADGQRVVTASEDGTGRIWDANTGKELTARLQHKAPVHWARFSPNGLWVVTASYDGTARIWDARTGRPLTEPLRHRATVGYAEFGPDNSIVVTGSNDGTARLWDSRTGRPLTEPLPTGGHTWVKFAPDGHRFVTASTDGTARVWEVPAWPGSDGTVLADLAEAVIGQRLNEAGGLEHASRKSLDELRHRVKRDAATNAFDRWVAWFLADRSSRTISPGSPITIPEYVSRRTREEALSSAREAVLLSPTNALALAHLAERIMANAPTNSLTAGAQAEYLSRLAERLSPDNLDARPIRERIKP